jgi:hypothetical protein
MIYHAATFDCIKASDNLFSDLFLNAAFIYTDRYAAAEQLHLRQARFMRQIWWLALNAIQAY